MGWKLKKFKAKLTWKSKERVPEVLCLKYQVYSEFTESTNYVPPAASETNSDQVYDYSPINSHQTLPVPSSEVERYQNKNINGVNTSNTPDINQYEDVASPKGILKKTSAFDFDVKTSVDEDENKNSSLIYKSENHDEERKMSVEETPKSILKRNSDDENKKSALIFMTENHDDDEERRLSVEEKPRSILKRGSETDDNLLRNSTETERTDSENESDEDLKTVRWRNTLVEIRPPSEYVEMSSNQNLLYDYAVQHQEESEYEEVEERPRYRYSTVYSDQAASIFFAGEEPNPTPRIRKVSNSNA